MSPMAETGRQRLGPARRATAPPDGLMRRINIARCARLRLTGRMDEAIYEGGCLCGQVRWRARGQPANVRVCHCRLCQTATGAPFFARAIFAGAEFSWSGETTSWPSSPRIDRRSCARCGTPLFACPKDPPARIGVSVATCDDRHALAPTVHIWASEAVCWIGLDGLPRCEAGFQP